jgi:hypothetical protein
VNRLGALALFAQTLLDLGFQLNRAKRLAAPLHQLDAQLVFVEVQLRFGQLRLDRSDACIVQQFELVQLNPQIGVLLLQPRQLLAQRQHFIFKLI